MTPAGHKGPAADRDSGEKKHRPRVRRRVLLVPVGVLTSALSWWVGHRQLFEEKPASPAAPAAASPAPIVRDEDTQAKLVQVQADVAALKGDVAALKDAEQKRVTAAQKEQERKEILQQLEERLGTLDKHLGPGRIRRP